MEIMQIVIGGVVSIIILVVSVVWAINELNKEGSRPAEQALTFAMMVILRIIGLYVLIGIIGGILWIIAWIGVFLREILMWLIEAVFWFIPA